VSPGKEHKSDQALDILGLDSFLFISGYVVIRISAHFYSGYLASAFIIVSYFCARNHL
jgi:hypothetical protein